MKRWLVDAGPLVALLSPNDHQREWASEQARLSPSEVTTCDAVISEACYLLKRDGQESEKVFTLIESGFLRSAFDLQAEHRAVHELMRRYRDTPMSFADACLVRMAELDDGACLWTLDRDFSVYRKHRRQTLSLVTPW